MDIFDICSNREDMQNFFIISNKFQIRTSCHEHVQVNINYFVFSAIAFVFTSSLIISNEQTAQATSLKKDLIRFSKDVKEKLKDNDDDKKEDDKKEDDKKEDDKKESNTNYDYSFSDEGDTKREDFNFVAAGDYGCSKNAKNTINSMKDKKPELVLPLGDLSVDNTATCWLDLASPFDDRLQMTFGYSEVKDGESKLNQYKKAFGLDEPLLFI